MVIILFALLAVLVVAIVILLCRSEDAPKPRYEVVADPAVPEIQDRALERLAQLPHFRRLRDGSLHDYFRGSRLSRCTCSDLPFPHLLLKYGDKHTIAFETTAGLYHYIACQENIAALLVSVLPRESPSPSRQSTNYPSDSH